MHQVTNVTTGFSENSQLANRTFTSILQADLEITRIMAQSYTIADRCYDKTDVAITWSDGHEISFRLDANRVTNLSTTLAARYRYYCGHGATRPEHLTLRQWREQVRAYRNFFENYAI
jgi:hypothetical protein